METKESIILWHVKILDKIEGQLCSFSFSRKDQVVSLETKQQVKVKNDNLNISSETLFGRLVLAAKNKENFAAVFAPFFSF